MEMIGAAAVVTGGASGLGNATAKTLASPGARAAIFDVNEEVGAAAAGEIDGSFFNLNVADEASADQGFTAAEAARGLARLLVNCAGVAPAIRMAPR
jgi:NAD(P)-dependent dehydrogenase (short-subunit alcohol dehydrogenase family)